MNTKVNEVTINNVAYVRKSDIKEEKEINTEGMLYCIVRAHSAGVFAGYIKSRDKDEVVLLKARRLWYWEGAASLSQLAMEGVSLPEKCKFPCEVESVTLLGVIEIIPCTEKAYNSIKKVSIWKC